ncbi:hypothetical protein FOCC_FOCC003332 [Frankliniella occidentalis]|uniref:Uncharacterized protein LOC113204602 n=1 Tax=Frankliniella occidentalis TaxID=133901 RepID=A0A6J1SA84_FRAOC|nr:uncharacterized protein LOC113204602 [Frankliniella occidentalis]KAE8749863.1 hypothetical protein FOCC_FOCC003332 [Frankliniella occidentalis]
MDHDCVPSAVSVAPKAERIIKKIPGKLPPPPKEIDVLMGDLRKKSIVDLHELLERQTKILLNKSLVNKLSDKGERASVLKDRIEKELKSRDELDKAASLLSKMTLNQLSALEWMGHCNPGHRGVISTNVDHPECEETNPLKILATHSGTTDHQKQISTINEEVTLVKPEDLLDSEDSIEISKVKDSLEPTLKVSKDQKMAESDMDVSKLPLRLNKTEPFAQAICERYGCKEGKDRFKPNKPLKPFTGTYPLKPTGRISTKPKRWEETNVTPPPLVHTDSKLLSLEESIKLQQEQNVKLKDIQIKHATEKLSSLHGIPMGDKIPRSVLNSMSYRDPIECHSDSDEDFNEADIEDQEIHDEDQQDSGTTVVYNVET